VAHYADSVWRLIDDRGLRWRSMFVLLALFLPLAALIGWLLPGYWWWLGAAAYFGAFIWATHTMAKRDRRARE
jgi:hypothetical protein